MNSPKQHTGVLLRIIALLEELQPPAEHPALASHLASAPPAVWQAVMPQLFARLASATTDTAADASSATALLGPFQAILKRVASGCPSAVLYFAAAQARMVESTGQEEGNEAVAAILGCIETIQPGLVAATMAVLHELDRVAVLWEEMWHSVLAEAQVDVSRRLQKLRVEAARVVENAALDSVSKASILQDKYTAMMQPLLGLLDRTWRATLGAGACTPHEQRFADRYECRLQEAISALREPPPFAGHDASQGFQLGGVGSGIKLLVAELRQDTKVLDGSMTALSPKLMALAGTQVPLPGESVSTDSALTPFAGGPVTIASFGDEVQFLNTKTRPKRVSITGSNGQRYDFLLKGREDLHTDARIMQVMSLLSAQLAAHKDSASLPLRQYSITPLGNRVGLVQWVQNSVPLFSLFKQWQTRSVEASAAKSARPPDGAAHRPVELYYRHLTAALKDEGLQSMVHRNQTPKDVQLKVLSSLKRSVPARLLALELWASSTGPADWWARQTQYSQSTAVASMAGWLVGLGDRHLDNILLDKSSGAVIHIDYNVCLERGKHLKVPEVVPFRLTQMLAAALGLTGVSGVFRHAATMTMESMRRNSTDLQALLAACLEDPLVDWVAERKDAAARAEMETAVSLDLLASRYDEVKSALSSTADSLRIGLPTAGTELRRLMEAHSALSTAAADANDKHRKREALAAALRGASDGESAALASLQEAASTLSGGRARIQELRDALAAEARECQAWQKQHTALLARLEAMRVPELLLGDPVLLAGDAPCELGLVSGLRMRSRAKKCGSVVAALGNMAGMVAAPPELGAHWGAVDAQASELLLQRDQAVAAARSALQEYSVAWMLLLPGGTYADSSAHGAWSEVIEVLFAAHAKGAGAVRPAFPIPTQPEQARCRWMTIRAAAQLAEEQYAECTAASSACAAEPSAADIAEAEGATLAAFLACPSPAATSVLSALLSALSVHSAGRHGPSAGDPQLPQHLLEPLLSEVLPGGGGRSLATRLQALLGSLSAVAAAAGLDTIAGTLRPLSDALLEAVALDGVLGKAALGALLAWEDCCASADGWQARVGSVAARGATPLALAAADLEDKVARYHTAVMQSPDQRKLAAKSLENQLAAALGTKTGDVVLQALLSGTEALQDADQRLLEVVEGGRHSGPTARPAAPLQLVLGQWLVAASGIVDSASTNDDGSIPSMTRSDVAVAVEEAVDSVVSRYLSVRVAPVLRALAEGLGGLRPDVLQAAASRHEAETDVEAEWAVAEAANPDSQGGFFGSLPEDGEEQGGFAQDAGMSSGLDDGQDAEAWGGMDAAAGHDFFGEMPDDGEALEDGMSQGLEPDGLDGSASADHEDSVAIAGEEAADVADAFMLEESMMGTASQGALSDTPSGDGDGAAVTSGEGGALWQAVGALVAQCSAQAGAADLICRSEWGPTWAEWRTTLDMRLARLEWSCERALAMGGLVNTAEAADWPPPGALAAADPERRQACEAAGLALRSRRGALLRRMRMAAGQLRQAMEGMAGWENTSAAASADVDRYISASLLQTRHPNANAGVAALQQQLRARTAWLKRSGEAAVALMRTCEATLAFEDSRDGDAWMPAGHAATRLTDLVEGFLATQISIKAAEATAAQAQTAASRCRSDAALHAQALEPAREQSMDAVRKFEALAPRLMGAVGIAAPSVQELGLALEAAQPLVQDTAAMLRQACKVLEGVDVARDVLTMAAPVSGAWQGYADTVGELMSVLKQLGSTVAAAQHLLAGPSQQQQQQMSMPARAARLLEALRPTVAALSQVMPQVDALADGFSTSSAAQEVEELVGAAAGVAASIRQDHELEPEEGDVQGAGLEAELARTEQRARGMAQQRSAAARALASHAMRRFREKLEGVEPEGGTGARLSVGEHVDLLLSLATRPDRLAQMYEGWAAWI